MVIYSSYIFALQKVYAKHINIIDVIINLHESLIPQEHVTLNLYTSIKVLIIFSDCLVIVLQLLFWPYTSSYFMDVIV